MRQSTGKGRRALFLVGVALLSFVALWWLLVVLIAARQSENTFELIRISLLISAVLIVTGIYCMRHGRRAPAIRVQQRPEPREMVPLKAGRTFIAKDTESEIVVKMSWGFRTIGWCALLGGAYLLLSSIGRNGFWMAVAGAILALVGLWILGMTTKITFSQPPGYITVTRRNWPIFLWFLREKYISKEEARSVFVRSVVRTIDKDGQSAKRWAYQVRIVMGSGKELTLHEDWKPDLSQYLAKRILEFGQQ